MGRHDQSMSSINNLQNKVMNKESRISTYFDGSQSLTPILLSGTIASFLGQTLAYPLNTILINKMANTSISRNQANFFFRGYGALTLKVVPIASLSIFLSEKFRQGFR